MQNILRNRVAFEIRMALLILDLYVWNSWYCLKNVFWSYASQNKDIFWLYASKNTSTHQKFD